MFFRQAMTGLRLLLAMTVLLGIGYPLVIWSITRLPGLQSHAEGSRITVDGGTVGSSLIGVDPVDPRAVVDPTHDRYFHTRPSASSEGSLGPGDPATTGGSNHGGDNADLLRAVQERRAAIAMREGVAPARVPADAVTASASGVDPHISAAYAELQARRVARVNGVREAEVRRLVAEHTTGGVINEQVVNVTELNLAVDAAQRPTP